MRLWLIRHARPEVAPGVCYGALDVPADAAATALAARQLAAELPPDLPVYSSPLQRCALLARALQALRPDLAFHPDPRLAEMDFGHWEGRRWDALGEPALTAWTNDFAHHPPGGGESVQAFMTRVASAWRDAHRSGGSCAWITHAGVIRATALLEQGITTPTRADQWPAAVPGFGEWRVRTARQGTASHLETHPAGGARRNAGK